MSLSHVLGSSFSLARLLNELSYLSESISANASCTGSDESDECRDEPAAVRLKFIAIAAILFSGILGIAIPLLGRKFKLLDSNNSGGGGRGAGFVVAKAFAAGVILATGFVHMLNDGEEALTNECLPEIPWRRFPFSGFVAMLAALGTLAFDFLATQFYERKHLRATEAMTAGKASSSSTAQVAPGGNEILTIEEDHQDGIQEKDPNDMHIIGMHAHGHEHGHVHAHGHAHGIVHGEGESSSHGRHVVVSQILELGIVSHSVIIGLSLGVSQSPCEITPLIAALSFHQFFEGFALGGCISQAQFNNCSALLMATFFAVTTPIGIGCGAAVVSFYNANSPIALIVEGILDSISAGILIYMALVDLIAADFLSRKVNVNLRVHVVSYLALFLGALSMSALAIWA